MVGCRRDLAITKGTQVIAGVTYFKVGPEADNPRELFEPLLPGLLRPIKRSRVSGVTVVLVQGLGDMAQVPLFESLAPLVHEFDLWRDGAF